MAVFIKGGVQCVVRAVAAVSQECTLVKLAIMPQMVVSDH